MEKRTNRVSEGQWQLLLDFLEAHPALARAQGYNNSAKRRAESARLWQEVANLLNAEGLGAIKTAKDWSLYVSNYKGKLKKIVAGINADANGTGGGPPRGGYLSDTDHRFLSLMGTGFGQQTAPQVQVNPLTNADPLHPSTSAYIPTLDFEHYVDVQENVVFEDILENIEIVLPTIAVGTSRLPVEGCPPAPVAGPSVPSTPGPVATGPSVPSTPGPVATGPSVPHTPALVATGPSMPRQTRTPRYRTRPMAPIDEARRILSEVEMQRAAADAARSSAISTIAVQLGRIADSFEKYVSHISQ